MGKLVIGVLIGIGPSLVGMDEISAQYFFYDNYDSNRTACCVPGVVYRRWTEQLSYLL